MSCKGCKKNRSKFKRAIMKEILVKDAIKDHKEISLEKQRIHFMNVCVHGVPNRYYCKGCDKIIKIPDDAVIKPDGYVQENVVGNVVDIVEED